MVNTIIYTLNQRDEMPYTLQRTQIYIIEKVIKNKYLFFYMMYW